MAPPQMPPEYDRSHANAAMLFLTEVRGAMPAVYDELCMVLRDYAKDPAAPTAPADTGRPQPSRQVDRCDRIRRRGGRTGRAPGVRPAQGRSCTGTHPYLLRAIAGFLPKPACLPPPPHAAGGEQQQYHRPSSLKRKKRPRADNGATSGRNALELDGDGAATLHKKPRTARGGIKIKRHPLDGGEESESCWHFTGEESPDEAAGKFEKMLGFHAWYSKLVTTTRRAEELAEARHPRQGALAGLFADHQCHEILDQLFGGGWRTVEVVLDGGGGEHVDPTLATMLLLLKEKEDAAVDLMMRRRDKARYGAPAAANVSDRPRRRP
uniref:Uncharacterized protein n=1 Tax=Oryza brachyantha TaxID=4533 RepID=J3KV72_ORYBR